MSPRTGPSSLQPHSVKDLLARRVPALRALSDQMARQNFWNEWLSGHLSAEIRPRISGVAESEGTLVIFAESAAWSARLRYALRELEADMRAANPELTDIRVRVLPRGERALNDS